MKELNEVAFKSIALLLGAGTVVGWILACIGLIGLITALVCFLHKSPQPGLSVKRALVFTVSVLFLILPLWFVEFVKDHRIIISENGSVVQAFPKNTIIWQNRWDKLISQGRLTDYRERYVRVAMSAHPITDNPKVRSLKYSISVKSYESPEALIALESVVGKYTYAMGIDPTTNSDEKAKITNKIRFLLFEFNEKKSKDLATLYNPLDDAQQARFKAMVKESIGTQLTGIGCYLDYVAFDIGE